MNRRNFLRAMLSAALAPLAAPAAIASAAKIVAKPLAIADIQQEIHLKMEMNLLHKREIWESIVGGA